MIADDNPQMYCTQPHRHFLRLVNLGVLTKEESDVLLFIVKSFHSEELPPTENKINSLQRSRDDVE